jgi:Fe-S-cluster containining protein
MPASPSASSLCTSCGLCCNGAIFGEVPIRPDESAEMRRLGLDLTVRDDSEWFPQPCAMLCGSRCSIYESRPGTCRSYRCRVLAACERGELGEAEARATIDRAKSLVAAVEPHLREGQTLAEARVEWAERRATGRSLEQDADRVARAPFDLAVTALNLFLDRHFRVEKQKMVVTTPVAPVAGSEGGGAAPADDRDLPPHPGP